MLITAVFRNFQYPITEDFTHTQTQGVFCGSVPLEECLTQTQTQEVLDKGINHLIGTADLRSDYIEVTCTVVP